MKFIAISIFIVISGAPCPGQSYAQAENSMLSSFWDFYADNRLALQACGRGYTGAADEGELALGILNPAAMANVAGWQFCAGYAYKGTLPWLKGVWGDVGEMNVKTLHPCGMIGCGTAPSPQWQAAALVYDIRSYRFEEGHLGQTHEDVRQTEIYLPVAWEATPVLKLGLGLAIDRHSLSGSLGPWRTTASFYSLGLRAGLIVRPNQTLSLGLAFGPGSSHSFTETSSWTESDGSITEMKSTAWHHEPAVLLLGIKVDLPGSPVSLMADLEHVQPPEGSASLNDRNDLHLGFEHRGNETVYRAGFFTARDYRIRERYLNPGDNSQYFLTCGLTKYIGDWGLTLSLMDSHLLSPGEWKTTIANAGVNYNY